MSGKLFIIPVFLPWMGCTNRCIYCNEIAVTGYNHLNFEDKHILEKLNQEVDESLKYASADKKRQIAFFGGSFSNTNVDIQKKFLDWAYAYIKNGTVDSIRLSTRPDGITDEIVRLYKRYQVESIELGVQSFFDDVLKKNNRGHDAQSCKEAVRLLKTAGIETGVHLMLGLYGSDREKDRESFDIACSIHPDTLRIHPTLVLKDTALERLWHRGDYEPLDLRTSVEEMGRMYNKAEGAGIKMNRIGLFIPAELEDSVVAGPYNQSIGDMTKIMAFVLKIIEKIGNGETISLEKADYDRVKSHKDSSCNT
ncbi:MAG TPA: radical SAM protein [Thermotogota bacterium]|nr:radical SAM protein [Thermotogota bacterium]